MKAQNLMLQEQSIIFYMIAQKRVKIPTFILFTQTQRSIKSQLKSLFSNSNKQHNNPPISSQSNDPTTNELQTFEELNQIFKQIIQILISAIRQERQLIYTSATTNVNENPKEKIDSKMISKDSNKLYFFSDTKHFKIIQVCNEIKNQAGYQQKLFYFSQD
ncbi:hypothetical protein ABPG72_014356 [Tetrahymena utriculariae]